MWIGFNDITITFDPFSSLIYYEVSGGCYRLSILGISLVRSLLPYYLTTTT